MSPHNRPIRAVRRAPFALGKPAAFATGLLALAAGVMLTGCPDVTPLVSNGGGGSGGGASQGGHGGRACPGSSTANECNPFTNAGCAAGHVCEHHGSGATASYACQPVLHASKCDEKCGQDTDCAPGLVCGTTKLCAQICCSGTDCGQGTCDKSGIAVVGTLPCGVGLCLFSTEKVIDCKQPKAAPTGSCVP